MRKRWSTEEFQLVCTLYPTHTVQQIADLLGRSYMSVCKKLQLEHIHLPSSIRSERFRERGLTLSKNQSGAHNPNWKEGISKNKYHYKQLQIKRYPEKCKAREIVYEAVRLGKLHKGYCEVCGEKKTQAHHDDYTKPLVVRWLCKKCHDEWHRKHTSNYKGYVVE